MIGVVVRRAIPKQVLKVKIANVQQYTLSTSGYFLNNFLKLFHHFFRINRQGG